MKQVERFRESFSKVQSEYPYDTGLNGYRPYMSFTVLAVATYIVTLLQYDPFVIGSVLYYIPVLTGLAYYILTDLSASDNTGSANSSTTGDDTDETQNADSELEIMFQYLVMVLFVLFISYVVYAITGELTATLQTTSVDIPFGLGAVLGLVGSTVEILVGISVTAVFYYTLYVFSQILVKSTD